MKKILVILLLLSFTLAPQAQQQRRGKSAAKKTAVTKKRTGQDTKKKNTASKVQPTSVKALEKERKRLQQQIREQEARLSKSQQDVKRRLQNLLMINTEIAGKRRTIDTIRHDISGLDVEIETLIKRLDQLQHDLQVCKERYVKSMRYMHRNRSAQSQLMFIFSADNMTQMFRRMRFMREYAAYQHVQGDEVKMQQEEVNRMFQEISAVKSKKTRLLAKGEQERRELEGKQTEQQKVVKTLQKEQKTIQGIIAQQKKKDAALNAQIDRLIAEEIARNKAREEAAAKRKAEREARARKLAEAKAREENAKAEARAARSKKEREVAERKVREAEKSRKEEERSVAMIVPTEDMRISGNFASNRGRLPMPITGPYRIVNRFGQHDVEGLRNMVLDNKGIDIKGEPGCQARCIFDGEVSAVFSFAGSMVVMVRHGEYISVYCNLSSVNVHRGQRVSTRQVLGRVGQDNILQFQLRQKTAKLNPERWLGR